MKVYIGVQVAGSDREMLKWLNATISLRAALQR
jgi:hypothetical protein